MSSPSADSAAVDRDTAALPKDSSTLTLKQSKTSLRAGTTSTDIRIKALSKEAFGSALDVSTPTLKGLDAWKAFFKSRIFIDDFKATLSFIIGLAWIFWWPTNTLFQSRVQNNIMISIVVNTAARTIGTFLDGSFLLLIGLGIAALCWILVNEIAGTSYWAMSIILFIFVYGFSYLRAASPRFFGVGVIGPLLAYTACTSAIGISGANTSHGDVFDSAFLINTLYSFLIGTLICLVINILVFPNSAESILKHQFSKIFSTLSKLLTLSVKSYSPLSDPVSDTATRKLLISQLKAQISLASVTISQADAEVFYSRYDMDDYVMILGHVNSMASQLFAIHTALEGHQAAVVGSEKFQKGFSIPMEESLGQIVLGVRRMLEKASVRVVDLRGKKGVEVAKGAGIVDLESGVGSSGGCRTIEGIRNALEELETKQFDVIFRVYAKGVPGGVVGGFDDLVDRGAPVQEGLMQVNFFTLGLLEFVSEMDALYKILADPTKQRKLRFHYRHFIPDFRPMIKSLFSGTLFKKRISFRYIFSAASKFFTSTQSIFALKCGFAIVIYFMVAIQQPTFYRTWNMQGSFITLLVAIAPSLGQTTMSFVINLLGSTIGNLWAFASIASFGTGYNALKQCGGAGCQASDWLPQIGLGIMALLISFPMNHVFLNSKVNALGLLALLSYSSGVVGPYLQRANPFFDSPWVRFYKNMASLTMAITFALVFSLAVYPNLARHALRHQISATFRLLSAHYTDLISTAVTLPTEPPKSPSLSSNQTKPQPSTPQQHPILPTTTITRLKTTHIQIQQMLSSMEPLMVFSAAELRTEAPFQISIYREILTRINNILDRLQSARVSLGDKPIDPAVLAVHSKSLTRARKEMQATVRLLLYIFASTMVAKMPMPFDLPNAIQARNKIFREFSSLMAVYLHEPGDEGSEESGVSGVTSVTKTDEQKKEIANVAVGRKSQEENLFSGRIWNRDSIDGNGSVVGGDDSSDEFDQYRDWALSLAKSEGLVVPKSKSDLARVRSVVRSEAFMRYFSFALAMRMLAVEVDALVQPFKTLFGELPNVSGTGPFGERPMGKRGVDEDVEEVVVIAEQDQYISAGVGSISGTGRVEEVFSAVDANRGEEVELTSMKAKLDGANF
ncbi:hypothetical protein HDU76_002083 [Blyttiomyces sp. JEL0837]|nr:hypothetical protein HDU76_002083 [Blyttiomyces sp. JEL0837]